MDRTRLARYILIGGLGFVFAAFGLWKFTQPTLWLGWIPLWMEGILGISRSLWLSIIGGAEIALAVALIVPIRRLRQISCSLMALHLLAVLSQAGFTDVGVRDGGLLMASMALLLLL